MKYMGSKRRISKYIIPIILKDRKENQWYVEPFAGGFNMIDQIGGKVMASDSNFYLISMFKKLQDGWMPPLSVSEEEYNNIKNNKDSFSPELVGYVGFNSYGAKFFGGYRRDKEGKRDYWREHFDNISKQKNRIKDIVIKNKNYDELMIPKNSIVYCDPPYANSTKYQADFDHDKFWDWCRMLSKNEHKVFVSEYSAPSDFDCLWEMEVNNTLMRDSGSKKGVEKLFTYKQKDI